MFLENYHRLCNKLNVAPSTVCEMIGLRRAAYSRWVNGSIPSEANLQRLADFFGCTVAELTDGEKNTPPSTDGDAMDIRQAFRERPELRILFDAGKDVPTSAIYEAAALLLKYKEAKND